MNQLPILSAREVLAALKRLGFEIVRQKGSHIKLKKKIGDRMSITIVPNHKNIMRGTLKGVLELAEVKPEDFINNL